MGTYLSLTLKDRTKPSIELANSLWNEENPEYENLLHFATRKDILADIAYINHDEGQKHLRYIKTPEQWNREFPCWGYGQFQVKITLGDYLCSEMAKRYIAFIEKHSELFVEVPSDYVMELLKEKAEENTKAEECLVKCPYCKGI